MAKEKNEKKFMSATEILSVSDIETREEWIPEWNTWVRIRGMTGSQRDRFEDSMLQGKGRNQKTNLENLRAKLVVASVVDENGKPLFKKDHIAALGSKAVKPLGRIVKVAQEINGITDDDIEELTKNSEMTPGEDSPSA